MVGGSELTASPNGEPGMKLPSGLSEVNPTVPRVSSQIVLTLEMIVVHPSRGIGEIDGGFPTEGLEDGFP
jgi:hypothetical protein